jgi:small multidrug resistance pump
VYAVLAGSDRRAVLMAWLMVAAAIASEVTATLALRGTADGVRPLHVVTVAVGYTVSFILLGYALRTLNVGAVYAIWAGVGTAGVAIVAAIMYGERLNLAAIGGIALIVVGVVVLTTSGATSHA